MIDQDIYRQLWEWFQNPLEYLEVEVKWWLDLDDREHQWTIAKGLIALENHWWWRLIIWYTCDNEKRLVPDSSNRPANLEKYNTDSMNSILARFAEPKFHVDVTIHKHPNTWEEFPVICVYGETKVPVRSNSGTDKSIKSHCYFVRRPWPSSEQPRDAIDWDKLMNKCILQQRGEIVGMLRKFVGIDVLQNEKTDEYADLHKFIHNARARWEQINKTLSEPVRNKFWYYSFWCQIVGNSKKLSFKEIRDGIMYLRKYTWWPLFLFSHNSDECPSLIWDCLEVSLKSWDSAHANFWRVCPEGFIYVSRGYQEDCHEDLTPWTSLDIAIPAWRVGEFLLIVNELWKMMFDDWFSLLVTCEWRGIENRSIISLGSRRHVSGKYQCKDWSIQTKWKFDSNAIESLLPDVVKTLLKPFYEKFSFLELADEFYSSETNELKTGRYG